MASSRVFRHAALLGGFRSRPALVASQHGTLSAFRTIHSSAKYPTPLRTQPVLQHQHRAYSSQDPSFSPAARSVIATTRAVRNILVYSVSTLTLGLFLWSGTHAYLEQYKCPSPEGCSSTVQNCLHGAWVREEFAPDPDVAEIYLQKALELTRQELKDLYKKKNKGDATSFLEIEKDKALVEIQNRLARFYGRIGRDEQAATIWTRLWKLTEKANPRDSSSSSSDSSWNSLFFGSSPERPLVTKQEGIQYSKRAADCWMRMGEYDLAEEALAWTLSTLTANATSSPSSPSSLSSTSIEEVGLLSTLGTLYVRQARFEYALSLFVKALQSVQEHRAAAETLQPEMSKGEKDMWFCREAILTSSIGETLFGAAAATTPSSTGVDSTANNKNDPAEETKPSSSSSSWKFWSSSPKASPSATTPSKVQLKTSEQSKKEEEALGWIQKAIAMAKEKSGDHRDCDECAALGLSNLGLIYEMEGKTDEALTQFREAVLYATKANDYVGIEDYNRNIARLTGSAAASEDSTTNTASSSPASPASSSKPVATA
ncbi:hypothetical protein BGX28_001070 [Mortierella sp. GBA30]|nr:hypothetical protein BGX28_001070 [Mortierella sp. GBA30]